jgi:hypothetical protein
MCGFLAAGSEPAIAAAGAAATAPALARARRAAELTDAPAEQKRGTGRFYASSNRNRAESAGLPSRPRIKTRGAVAGAWRRRVNSLVRMPSSAQVCAYVIHSFRQIRTTRRADTALLHVCRLAGRAQSGELASGERVPGGSCRCPGDAGLREVHGGCIRVYGRCTALGMSFVCLSMPGVRDYPAGWCSHGRFPWKGAR